MAILEHNWLLSDNQQVLTAQDSTNVVDLSSIRNLGKGETLYLHSLVTTSATKESGSWNAGTNLTIVVSVGSDEGVTADEIIIAQSAPMYPNNVSNVMLTANSQIFLPIGLVQIGELYTPYTTIPESTSETFGQRYLRVYYSWDLQGGDAVAAFNITTRLTLDQSTMPDIYPASTST